MASVPAWGSSSERGPFGNLGATHSSEIGEHPFDLWPSTLWHPWARGVGRMSHLYHAETVEKPLSRSVLLFLSWLCTAGKDFGLHPFHSSTWLRTWQVLEWFFWKDGRLGKGDFSCRNVSLKRVFLMKWVIAFYQDIFVRQRKGADSWDHLQAASWSGCTPKLAASPVRGPPELCSTAKTLFAMWFSTRRHTNSSPYLREVWIGKHQLSVQLALLFLFIPQSVRPELYFHGIMEFTGQPKVLGATCVICIYSLFGAHL